MKLVRIISLSLVAILSALIVILLLIFNDLRFGPLPNQEGEIQLAAQTLNINGEILNIPGLIDKVEIFRDSWGFPHIYASNSHDLFFAQGFTHAQDRWWQMEFARHIGSGRIQELTGKNASAMSNDIGLRTMGWRRVAEREVMETYDEETLAILQAFADGVNAYILNRSPDDLALEYSLLGLNGVKFNIEPWTPADSIVWGKAMAWDLRNDGSELLRSQMIEALGEEMTAEYFPAWPYGQKPTILAPEDLPLSEDSLSTHLPQDTAGIAGVSPEFAGNMIVEQGLSLGHGEDVGSNNWAVSGQLTQSGKPLVANDMHLGIQMPSIWYEIGLHCQPVSEACPYNVVGFQFAPAPLITAGHNDYIAWGFTDHTNDDVDYYLIKVNPENPLQYEWNGEWRDMTVRDEEIRVGDSEETVTIQVRETHLGPIVNDNQIDNDGNIQGFNNEDPRAMRWTALEPNDLYTALVLLARAQNWADFRRALTHFAVPSQNVIYADVEGNIGLQNPGKIPIRAEGHSGLLPVPGWTDAYEWKGYIPFDSLPRIYNPMRGYIATANQANVPLEYFETLREHLESQFGEDANYVYAQQWDYGYRGQRINELLVGLAPHDAETFRAIYGDNKNISAEELMPYILELNFADETLTSAQNWLAEWDYQMHMDSPQAALYGAFWLRLVDNLFNDQLGELPGASGSSQNMWATYLLAQDPENVWWDDTRTAGVTETRDDILVKSFREAYELNSQQLGDDRSKWRWGDLHTATFVSNPLGVSGIDLLERIVNRGPVAVSGSTATVNAASWNAASGSFEIGSAVSERVVYDLGDWSRSLSVITTGQSGHPYSPHYDDAIDMWRLVEFKPMLWTREQVEQAAAQKLILQP